MDPSVVNPKDETGDEESEEKAESDIDQATLEVTEDDLSGESGDIFDGLDDADSTTSQESFESGESGEEEDEGQTIAGDIGAQSEGVETAINEGAARLGVVGLTDEDFDDLDLNKDGLEDELCETFEAFRLGYFGSRALDEYILSPEDDDISPAWGLLGSVMMAGALTIWMRPDGDERVSSWRESIESLMEGE